MILRITISFLCLWSAVLVSGNGQHHDFQFDNDDLQITLTEPLDLVRTKTKTVDRLSHTKDKSVCPYSENKIILSLVLREHRWTDIVESKRGKAISKLAKFFNILNDNIDINDVTKTELYEMTKYALKRSRNNLNMNKNTKLGRLEFIVGCGDKIFSSEKLIANQIPHQMKDGVINDISGLDFGFWSIWKKHVNNRVSRVRRQADADAGADADGDYDYENDYDETEDTGDDTSATEHPHRHGHGYENKNIENEDSDVITIDKTKIILNADEKHIAVEQTTIKAVQPLVKVETTTTGRPRVIIPSSSTITTTTAKVIPSTSAATSTTTARTTTTELIDAITDSDIRESVSKLELDIVKTIENNNNKLKELAESIESKLPGIVLPPIVEVDEVDAEDVDEDDDDDDLLIKANAAGDYIIKDEIKMTEQPATLSTTELAPTTTQISTTQTPALTTTVSPSTSSTPSRVVPTTGTSTTLTTTTRVFDKSIRNKQRFNELNELVTELFGTTSVTSVSSVNVKNKNEPPPEQEDYEEEDEEGNVVTDVESTDNENDYDPEGETDDYDSENVIDDDLPLISHNDNSEKNNEHDNVDEDLYDDNDDDDEDNTEGTTNTISEITSTTPTTTTITPTTTTPIPTTTATITEKISLPSVVVEVTTSKLIETTTLEEKPTSGQDVILTTTKTPSIVRGRAGIVHAVKTTTPEPEEDNYDDEYDDSTTDEDASSQVEEVTTRRVPIVLTTTTPTTTPTTTTTERLTTTSTTTPPPTTPTTPITSTAPTTEFIDEIDNLPPSIKNRFAKQAVTAGKPFSIIVPLDTFNDHEDGTNLKLEFLDTDEQPLKSTSWIQFNPETREIYGLPLEDNVSRWPFKLRATDSSDESVTETVDISVHQHKSHRSANHEISIGVKLHDKFPNNIDWQIKLIRGIVDTLGDPSMSNVVVRSVRYSQQDHHAATFVYTNETLPKDKCPEIELDSLVEQLNTNAFNAAMRPAIIIKSVVGIPIGPCLKTVDNTPKPTPHSTKNYPPLIRNQVDKVNATVGELLIFKVPTDTFYDPEDLNDLKLSLSYGDHSKLDPKHWLQFDPKNNEFYGIPKTGDVGQSEFLLVAEDRGGLRATDALVVIVNQAHRRDYGLEFETKLGIPYENFNNSASQRKYIERMAKVFNDPISSHIQIRYILPDHPTGVIVSFHNTTLHRNRCPTEQIEELRNHVLYQDASLRSFARDILGNEFNLQSIKLKRSGVCLGIGNDVLTGEIIPIKSEDSTPPVDKDDYLLTFVLPAVIIVAMLLLAAIIACILYRRRLTGKMELGDEEERRSFRSKGIPVIFQDELDEKPEIGNKSPVILKDEKPPLLPPSYTSTNPDGDNEDMDEYVPPPAVVMGGRETRGKSPVTPSYRKPPPYVSP